MQRFLIPADEKFRKSHAWRFIFLKQQSFTKKESPDVETPGLLVKALISSYFMMAGSRATLYQYIFSATNIIE